MLSTLRPKLTYSIARWRSPFDENAADFTKCYRSDKARAELWRMIYDMLDAEGLRDRPVAYRLLTEFENCDTSAPHVGHIRSQTFGLRGDTGPYVHFWAQRV